MSEPPPELDPEIAKAHGLIDDLVRALARRAARRAFETETKAAAAGEGRNRAGARELDSAIRAFAELMGEMVADQVLAAAAQREPEPNRSKSRQLHSLTEAAAMLAISRKTLKREIAAGNLPFILIGKRHKIDAGDLQRYVDQRRRRVDLPQIARSRAARGRSPVYDFEAEHAKRMAERQKRKVERQKGRGKK